MGCLASAHSAPRNKIGALRPTVLGASLRAPVVMRYSDDLVNFIGSRPNGTKLQQAVGRGSIPFNTHASREGAVSRLWPERPDVSQRVRQAGTFRVASKDLLRLTLVDSD